MFKGGIVDIRRAVIQNFRPEPIIIGYWKEVIAIEEDAEIKPVEFLEAA